MHSSVSLAWYTSETSARLREVADDAQALDGTFEEWERGALAAIREVAPGESPTSRGGLDDVEDQIIAGRRRRLFSGRIYGILLV